MNFYKFSLLISLISLTLTSCGSSPNSTSTNLTNSNQQPAEKTLKLLYWQAPTILNPHLSTGFKDSEASRISLEPLASFNNQLELVPFLAAEIPTLENGGIAKDGKSVTWKLKKNVNWSDGKPFTADDVIFTYEFISNPKVGTTTSGTYEIIKDIEKIDSHTIKINFKSVTPGWYSVFVGTEGMILPRHIFEAYNGENSRQAPGNLKPVGTGPYRVVEFKPGDVVIYEANPNFRAAKQLGFDRLELKGGGDAASAARAVLQTGDADYAYNLQVESNVLKPLESAGKGKVVSNFGALMERIMINQTDPNKTTPDGERSSLKFPHPFFSDPKVRQALSLAINREIIANQLYGILGQPTSNFVVNPAQVVSPNTTYQFNLEKAAKLLDEAGWKDTNNNGIRDKNGVEMNLVFQTSVNPLRQKTQEVIKQSLEQLGMKVELKSIDPTVYFSGDPANPDTTERFAADLQLFSTGNTNPDPTAYLKTYTCDQIPQKANNWTGDNFSRYCHPEYDGLWKLATIEINPEKQKQIWIKMNDMLVNNNIVIPLIHRAEVEGVNQNLTGVELTPWDLTVWNIKDWKKTP
ncbi:MAG TPA: peptide ABC transporter substrate-binding protein [Planktothrix sp. UBA8407]|jgi:ABC-type dipeptide transport system, periplasmic component|nr:peptide ABC transporter substrate-binding protein [Planktothrix sp. UBA8407]HBK23691.1 peptide ABC transporter substrate-binding protein [Planktothrix sp. UBA10369]